MQPFRAPDVGLPPPGNGKLDTLDKVVTTSNGQAMIVGWEDTETYPRPICLAELLPIPTPLGRRNVPLPHVYVEKESALTPAVKEASCQHQFGSQTPLYDDFLAFDAFLEKLETTLPQNMKCPEDILKWKESLPCVDWPSWNPADVEEFRFYTDGSFDGMTSSWAFCCLVRHQEEWSFLGHQYGLTVPFERMKRDHSALVGELQALLWSGSWTLRLARLVSWEGCVTFCWDSTVAGHKADGDFVATCDFLSEVVRHIFQGLEALLGTEKVRHKHVRAHTGICPNEYADCLAKHALKQGIAPPEQTAALQTLLDCPNGSLQWLWWHLRGETDAERNLDSLPRYRDGRIEWEPRADTFVDAAQVVHTSIFPAHERVTSEAVCLNFTLQIGTYNCLSLGPSDCDLVPHGLKGIGRVALVRKEASRPPSGTVRSRTHLRLCSGKHTDGTLGIELWIALDKPYCFDESGHPVHFYPHEFAIVFGDPRLLVVACQSKRLETHFVIGHAPHSGATEEIRSHWWQQVDDKLKQAGVTEFVRMLDANARVAASSDAHFGDVADGHKDHVAEHLRAFASAFDLFAPATFSTCHEGPIATWVHPAHQTPSRIDYVLLPRGWHTARIWSWTEPQLHSGHLVVDHICAAVYLEWSAWTHRTVQCGSRYDRSQVVDPANHEAVKDIISGIPEVAWQVNATQHVAEITDYLQQSLAQHFPLSRKRSKPTIASEDAQQCFDLLTKAKRQLRYYSEIRRNLVLRLVFQCWRDPNSDQNSSLWLGQFFRTHALLSKEVPALAKRLRVTLRTERIEYITQVAQKASDAPAREVFRLLRPVLKPRRQQRDPVQPLPQVLKLDGTLTHNVTELCARWEEHFSLLEAGSPLDPITMTQEVVERQQHVCLPSEWDDKDIPTLCALENALRRVKPGRAPGPDALVPDLFRATPRIFATKLYPVLLKQCLRIEEAASSKGGRLVNIYKGRGSFKECGNYRGILLMNIIGKVLRSTLRPIVNKPYELNTEGLQLGGKPASQVLFGSQAARHFLAWGKQTRTSTGIVFCDVASAYYRVLRELTLGVDHQNVQLGDLINRLNLSPEVIPKLHAALEGEHAYGTIGATSPQQSYLREGLTDTWFHLGHLSSQGQCIVTNKGSRPGDSWADIVFNAVFHQVLQQISRELKEANLDFEITIPENTSPFLLRDSGAKTLVFQTTWADDLAVLLRFRDTTRLEADLCHATHILLKALRQHGMEASIGAGKTAALILVRGPNAINIRRRLFSRPNTSVCVLQEDTPVFLPLEAQYKHLGGIIDAKCNMITELMSRATKARSAYWRIARQVFRNRHLSLKIKCQIFRATVISVFVWGAGSWPMLSKQEHTFYTRTLWDLYRLLLPSRDCDGPLLYSHHDILVKLPVQHPDDLLNEARCRHYGAMIANAPKQLWALFALDTNSQSSYRQAIQWMWQAISRDQELPHFTEWEVWEDVIKHKPALWKRLVKNAGRRHLWNRLRVGHVNRWQQRLVRTFEARQLLSFTKPLEGESYCCLPCIISFRQKRQWFLHSFVKHGFLSRHGQAAQGRYCPKCAKLYRSQASLHNHLRYSASCCAYFWALKDQDIPQPDYAVHAHPQCPSVPVLHHEVLQAPTVPLSDHQLVAQDLQQALLMFVPEENEQDMTDALVSQLTDVCNRVLPYADICAGFEEWTHSLGTDYDPILRAAVARVRDWLFAPRTSGDGTTSASTFDPDHVEVRPTEVSPCRSWRPTEVLFLHFCSGRRRDSDVQACLEALPIEGVLTVISVDIAIDPLTCDLLDESQCERWLTMIQAEEISGTGFGPPCESWSIARFHFDPALGPHQPRPIRTRSELWGCLCVRWKEHTQLDTGNRLLAFAILVALGQAATGGFSFTEHPAEPSFLTKAPPDAPSIWYTQPLLWCMQSRLFTRILVQQGHYGAKSSKPTHLLLSGLDEPTALQIAARCRTHQLPTRGSIGREGTEWATTALKEYPASLCQMLAQFFLHWHLQQTALPQRELETDLSWIRGLCIELDQRPRRPAPGPDYAGGYARPN